jgi:hypothetical protein
MPIDKNTYTLNARRLKFSFIDEAIDGAESDLKMRIFGRNLGDIIDLLAERLKLPAVTNSQ